MKKCIESFSGLVKGSISGVDRLDIRAYQQDFAPTLIRYTFRRRTNGKKLSAKISRQLRLLRAHGIIRKLPRQHKCRITLKGVKLCNTLNAVLAASTENLIKNAA